MEVIDVGEHKIKIDITRAEQIPENTSYSLSEVFRHISFDVTGISR